MLAAGALTIASGLARAQLSPGPLSRAHADLEGNTNCLKCHVSKKEGMDARCLECHAEIAALREAKRGLHARVEPACEKCHPEHAGVDFELIDWPGGTPEGFDHGKTGWPLEGKHATAKCRDCHQSKFRKGRIASFSRRSNPSRSWVGLEPSCGACHQDPHAGRLGADCAQCHAAADWKNVAHFDHSRTDFPLSGKHAGLPCAKCHQPAGRSTRVLKPLPHAECSDCHRDPHQGRLGTACSKCHRVEGFLLVAQGTFDHDKTRWPLRGAHRTVACSKCHNPATPAGQRPAFATCGGCHADAHAGLATLGGRPADCVVCHSLDAFRPAILPPPLHAPGRFPLEGKHATVACGKCHRKETGPEAQTRLGRAAIEMRPAHDRCSTCHADAHGGQLVSRADRGECSACHGVEGWRPSLFSAAMHGELAFVLEGAHARIACSSCHGPDRKGLDPLPSAASAGTARVVLRGVERACVLCHRDPHRFAEPRRCFNCHTMESFVPAKVGAAEHRSYAFPLDGAHGTVPCFACHKELQRAKSSSSLIRAADGFDLLPLRDSRRLCAECHADPHGAQFSTPGAATACERCHGLEGFRPARRFDHDRDSSFRLGAGHARLACSRCHFPRASESGQSIVIYRGIPSRCEDCHGAKVPQHKGESR